MSVLIQDMEMPESCSVCKLSTTTERYELVCKLLNCYASDVDRETECPLIEIPPHGRLIDGLISEGMALYGEYIKGLPVIKRKEGSAMFWLGILIGSVFSTVFFVLIRAGRGN